MKRNVKPLKVPNACLNVSLKAKRSGMKPLSHPKNEVYCGIKKRSQCVNRSFPTNKNVKQRYNISSEQFTAIKGNRLPPCSVASTPTRRETYLVIHDKGEANKENVEFQPLKPRTKSPNDVYEPVDSKPRLVRIYESSSSIQNVSPVLSTPQQRRSKFDEENAEVKLDTETYKSHPIEGSLCTVRRRRIAEETNIDSSSDQNQNFLDLLNGFCFTPTPSRPRQEQKAVIPKVGYSSPEVSLVPPCNVSPTPDRRQTYAVPPNYKFGHKSTVQHSAEIVFRARQVQSTFARTQPDEFNDSLEDTVAGTGTERWSEWRKHNFSLSEGSAGTHCESVDITPTSKIQSTGLTPQFDNLNLSSQNFISFLPGSPVDFSLLAPSEDTRRCSTVMKRMEPVPYDSTYNVCKDLFSTDNSVSPDMNRLSSGTFVKLESSFADTNFHCPDIVCQESVRRDNSCQLQDNRRKTHISLGLKENSAQSVIEADLWVQQSSREKLSTKAALSENLNTLDIITEESKLFMPEEQKSEDAKEKYAIPVQQLKKCERDECREVFLEISPPKRQVYNTCGSTTNTNSVQKQKASQITGWSKTSVKSRNYPYLNITQGKGKPHHSINSYLKLLIMTNNCLHYFCILIFHRFFSSKW
jgi:hypothetical protein